MKGSNRSLTIFNEQSIDIQPTIKDPCIAALICGAKDGFSANDRHGLPYQLYD